jgi:hypothetical protein
LLAALVLSARSLTAQATVNLDVRVTLVDAVDEPIANAPARLVVGTGANWQLPTAGTRFVTDAQGAYHASLSASLETRERKLPSNFFTQLTSGKLSTRHLTLAVELPFLKHQWLYVSDVDYFPDGTTVQNALQIFGADARGSFTVPGVQHADTWTLPGFPGLAVPPGYAITRFVIAPTDQSKAHWTVAITIRREREPIVR